MTIQLVLPMAGRGERFRVAGYTTPKPLLPIHGYPMFTLVLNNLMSSHVGRVVVVAQESFQVAKPLALWGDAVGVETRLVEIDYTTEGPAMSVDIVRDILDPQLPVVVGNSDQYVVHGMDEFNDAVTNSDYAGQIMTMHDSDPKWSYVRLNADGCVLEVREKQVISNLATVGIYGFSSARILWSALDAMFENEARVNGEYYVAPAYSEVIAQGLKVGTVHAGPIEEKVFGLGIPEDYEKFLDHPVSRQAVFALSSPEFRMHHE